MCEVLWPGAAHISKITSFGWGSSVWTHTMEGMFCRSTVPGGNRVSDIWGQPDIVSVTSTAMPL